MPQGVKGGFPTYWTEFGSGPREALLIHCSLGHSGAWAGMAAHLGDILHMTAFDIPGHGRSGQWDQRAPLQRVATDMAADFIDRPIDLIGQSFGATVALRLATENSGLVRSLVLIEPVFLAVAFADDPDSRQRHDRDLADYDRAIKAGDMMAAAKGYSDVWGDGRPWDSLPASLRLSMAERIGVVEQVAPEVVEDSAGLLRRGAIEALEMPTLLIEGENTLEYIHLIVAGLHRRIGNSRCETVEGAGHMAPITHSGRVAELIRSFLDAEAAVDQPLAAARN
ncbi:alpha/beta fold hydrolase [Thalassovita aquimarina]|uniref:Alpha/beta hydrolase n=1 Tax=Thalassovita aquimarina TaxID=2785917 RepID=A0ABS5HWM5_9RHOB|nr:alpha/beta hydrolase [Thalassovita aquimarina]MBR9653182.1 alpha/beta hydrolase [Thalassovita aquimarina]